METQLLEILECPFCGGSLTPDADGLLRTAGGGLSFGILRCECCAYPIVDGIPYVRTGVVAERARGFVGSGRFDEALSLLLGLGEGAGRFQALISSGQATFRSALDLLCGDAEAPYLLHRFSDPTFLCGDALVRTVGADQGSGSSHALDVCGGAGHLTRSLAAAAPDSCAVLADIAFWKLWLAKRFVAPLCEPVCCDANLPLPFRRRLFSVVLCSDAFHYIWSRRGLADELRRLTAASGTVILQHLHNALQWNHSEGMPLTPAAYRKLFAGPGVRLFGESAVLDAVLAGEAIDLSGEHGDSELAGDTALVLIATERDDLWRRYAPPPVNVTRPVLNPLYAPERVGEHQTFALRLPSSAYESEYADCKRYLPHAVSLHDEDRAALAGGTLSARLRALAEHRVVLDLPRGYL